MPKYKNSFGDVTVKHRKDAHGFEYTQIDQPRCGIESLWADRIWLDKRVALRIAKAILKKYGKETT